MLAGGRGLRMGGKDKAFIQLAGKPLIEHVIARLAPQTGAIVINANREPSRLDGLSVPVIADSVPDFAGPLAGVLAGLEWAEAKNLEVLLTVPVDVPFLPADLVKRLREARRGNDVACASSGGRMHHVIALWPVSMAPRLRHALVIENLHKVEAWLSRHRVGIAEWPASPYDPFFNINAPQDLEQAEEIARGFFS
ncbi:MAG: molybdenum cofactor guanylyltransferase MobA [Hyphomicrobiales bacterium]